MTSLPPQVLASLLDHALDLGEAEKRENEHLHHIIGALVARLGGEVRVTERELVAAPRVAVISGPVDPVVIIKAMPIEGTTDAGR